MTSIVMSHNQRRTMMMPMATELLNSIQMERRLLDCDDFKSKLPHLVASDFDCDAIINVRRR